MNNKYHPSPATSSHPNSPRVAQRGPAGHNPFGQRIWHPVPQKPDLQKVGSSADGCAVFDRPNSHHHVDSTLIAEALRRITLRDQQFVKERIEFGCVIGNSDCVPTGDGEEIVFARRPGRAGLTRFAVGRSPEPCTSMIILLKRREDEPNSYILITAFVGTAAEPEPWDKNASPTSREFWSCHALVHGSCQIIPGTQTSVCPW